MPKYKQFTGKTTGAKVPALTTSFNANELHEADWIAANLSEVDKLVISYPIW